MGAIWDIHPPFASLIFDVRAVANVTGRVIKGSGHWLMEEAPQQTMSELVAFINGASVRPESARD